MSADLKDVAAVEDRCPFCGAEEGNTDAVYIRFNCGAHQAVSSGLFFRTSACYERQLAQQAELLRRVEEVVKNASNMSDSGAGRVWSDANKVRQQATALLPDLEAAVKETRIMKCQNDTICKFGIGEQDMATCRMIYIHFPGYYVTEKDYQDALARLCPNLRWEDEVE